jgi:hypothetical protein
LESELETAQPTKALVEFATSVLFGEAWLGDVDSRLLTDIELRMNAARVVGIEFSSNLPLRKAGNLTELQRLASRQVAFIGAAVQRGTWTPFKYFPHITPNSSDSTSDVRLIGLSLLHGCCARLPVLPRAVLYDVVDVVLADSTIIKEQITNDLSRRAAIALAVIECASKASKRRKARFYIHLISPLKANVTACIQ